MPQKKNSSRMPQKKTLAFAFVLIAILILVAIVAKASFKSKENLTGASNSKNQCWEEEWERVPPIGGKKYPRFTCPAFKGELGQLPGEPGFDPKNTFWKHYYKCLSQADKKGGNDIKEAEDAIVAHFQNPRNREKFKQIAKPYFTPGGAGGQPPLELERARKKGVEYLAKIDAVRRRWRWERELFTCITKKCNSCMFRDRLTNENYRKNLFYSAVDVIGGDPIPDDP